LVVKKITLIMILSVENSLKFSQVESQLTNMIEKVRIKLYFLRPKLYVALGKKIVPNYMSLYNINATLMLLFLL